jgi:hypothetical protein
VAPLVAAGIGLLVGWVLRLRSNLVADVLVLPVLMVGMFLVLNCRTPLEAVTTLLIGAYVPVLTHTRARR